MEARLGTQWAAAFDRNVSQPFGELVQTNNVIAMIVHLRWCWQTELTLFSQINEMIIFGFHSDRCLQKKKKKAYIYKLAYEVYSSGCRKEEEKYEIIFSVLMIDSIIQIIEYLF